MAIFYNVALAKSPLSKLKVSGYGHNPPSCNGGVSPLAKKENEMGRISIDQSHQVMATLAVNIDWGSVDFEGSGLQDLVVRNPTEVGRQFALFLRNGGRVLLASKFLPWKTISIGGKNQNQLLRELGSTASNWAQDLMRQPAFKTLTRPRKITLVRAKVSDLGFTEAPTTTELFTRAETLGLGKCPAEVGPHLRQQYADQPHGEWLRVAMESISDSDGYPRVFGLDHGGRGLWLGGDYAHPERRWDLDGGFVFAARNSLHFPIPTTF